MLARLAVRRTAPALARRLCCRAHPLALCAARLPPPPQFRAKPLLTARVAAISPPPTPLALSPPKPLRLLGRALWLGLVLLPPLALLAISLLVPSRWRIYLTEAFEASLLAALERGGACTIKLGQWASTRPDVLPLSLCVRLGSLHDGVPPHALSHTRRAISDAFGARAAQLEWVSERPVGSGCIAQVHRVTFRSLTFLATRYARASRPPLAPPHLRCTRPRQSTGAASPSRCSIRTSLTLTRTLTLTLTRTLT